MTAIFALVCLSGWIVRFIKMENKLKFLNPLHLIPSMWHPNWQKFDYFNQEKRPLFVYVILQIMVFNIWMFIWQCVEVPKKYLKYGPVDDSDRNVHWKWQHQMHQFLHSGGIPHICANLLAFFFSIITGEMLFGSSIVFVVFWSLFWTIENDDGDWSHGASGSTYLMMHFVWTIHLMHFWLFNRSGRSDNGNVVQKLLAWLNYASCCSAVLLFFSVCVLLYQMFTGLGAHHKLHSKGAVVGMCGGLFMIPVFMFKIHRSRQWKMTKMDYVYCLVMPAFGLIVFMLLMNKNSLFD